jgi:hypothetical protein
MKPKSLWSAPGVRIASVVALSCTAVLAVSVGDAGAKGGGGTAKPPANPAPFIVPPHPAVPAPVFTANVNAIHQFDVNGFIQAVDVDPGLCPGLPAAQAGGHVTVNGVKITVPCNSIVQMPANTLSWVKAVDTAHPALSIHDTGYPSFDVHVVGNTVGDKHIAGLVYLSQNSTASGQGYITSIDYATGRIHLGSSPGAVGATPGGADQVVIEINDPAVDPANPTNGRFGRAHSPDDRFSVDQGNPTVHAGTGYPMCVPRTTTDPTAAGAADDPLCPQANRPKPVNGHCRDFADAGLNPLPKAGNLTPPPVGATYCGHFVMPALPLPGTTAVAGTPDPRQQAPFEVGDYISYQGTLIKSGDPLGDLVSAHTVEANVGIFTQPGTQPAYTAIGDFGVGSADPSATAVNGVAQETQDRIFLEAETTDVVTPVDIYLVDVDPATGKETSRWVTPNAMTGENNLPNLSNATSLGGGITTQFTGAQPQRARLRATKAPNGLLTSPTRTLRVVQRTLCLPQLSQVTATAGVTYDATSTYGNVPQINGATDCLQSKPAANGLFAGQYTAPVFEYIFPENVQPGDPTVPNDLWDLGFLMNGEGAGTGRLTPSPW